ncbi:hypothetical protein BC829DRAFT_409782 [Chytridium lagenaria]|nr:hypothetical protein BC829DRAFT_409782 [Chytridium lagenaria]
MEETLDDVLDGISQSEGVKGVLLTDAEGLCLGARGKAQPSTAGSITSISNRAHRIAQESGRGDLEEATVSIETDTGRIVVRQEHGTTIAIFK